jgi:transcriptional regulator with XRE-family HTH domain
MKNGGSELLTFGQKIRVLRKARGWTLKELSRRCGLTDAYLSEMERSIVGFRGDHIDLFASIFEVSPAILTDPNISLERAELISAILAELSELSDAQVDAVHQMAQAFRK